MTEPTSFVHLHVHSDYSLLQAPVSINGLLGAVKDRGMNAVALTDLDSLSGMVPFYQRALPRGIKPIIGCEVHVAPGDRREKSGGMRASGAPLVLLARNHEGYHNLIKIVSDAALNGFYYRPRTDVEFLSGHAGGLIALSGTRFSELETAVFNGNDDEALEVIGRYQKIFGEDNYYVELVNQGSERQAEMLPRFHGIATKAGAPCVVTNDTYLADPDDLEAMLVLQGIGSGKVLEDMPRPDGPLMHIASAKEMAGRFTDYPEALAATVEIAGRCNVEIDFDSKHMPVFVLNEGQDPAEGLRQLVEEGLSERYDKITPEIRDRIEHELGVIERLGFPSYFLIVWDFIRFARERGIPVGPGRGSCVGSLVSFCLGITDLDPLDYDLLFERFLTEDRISDPDIDIDFCREGREEVINYVRDKYGHDNVAQIATFGTLGAKAVVRDVARVLNIPLNEADVLAKAIPDALKMTLDRATSENPDLEEMIEGNGAYKHLWSLARKLEGMHRHMSIHAAGVVIADAPLTDYISLTRSGESTITQYDKDDVEACGILKMDFLGLKTLTVLDKARTFLQDRGIDVVLETIPLDDEPTYRMLQKGESRNTFQFESAGMRDLMVKMKPDRFEDLIATVALYRPGPLNSGMVDDYVQIKHGHKQMDIPHPTLEPILKDTYGIIVFQEQAMLIANRMAGFSLAEADGLRKAMAKKKVEMMAAMRAKFLEGAEANKIPENVYTKIFDLIEKFGEYGFNKSHSAAYALVSYWTCWFKANHPAAYMAAVLTCDASNSDKVAEAIGECKRMGLDVLPPDINVSGADFTLDADDSIRFGLGAVKGVGTRAIESIIEVRDADGPFKGFFDFCNRIDTRAVNKAVVEALVRAGAFDSLEGHRAQFMAAVETVMRIASRAQSDRQKGQGSLFDALEEEEDVDEDVLPDVTPWTEAQALAFEKETVGFYLSNHPLARHEADLEALTTANLVDIAEHEDKSQVTIGGLVTFVRPLVTKKGKNPGKKMCALQLEDLYGQAESVVFPETFEKAGSKVVEDAILFISGKLDLSREIPKVIAESIETLEDKRRQLPRELVIDLKEAGLEDETLARLKQILLGHPGAVPVVLQVADASGNITRIRAGRELKVRTNPDLMAEIEDLLGPEHASENTLARA